MVLLQWILDSVTFLRFCLQDIKYSFMIEIFHPHPPPPHPIPLPE